MRFIDSKGMIVIKSVPAVQICDALSVTTQHVDAAASKLKKGGVFEVSLMALPRVFVLFHYL